MLSPVGTYASIARLTGSASPAPSPAKPLEQAAAAPAPEAAASFRETVAETAARAVATVVEGEKAAVQGLTGAMDAHQVVAAMSQAELTVQATIAIRDKMVQAYQDIMRMPI